MAVTLTFKAWVQTPELYGRYRNRIAYVPSVQTFNRSALAVRRIPLGSGFDPDWIELDVHVPADERSVLDMKMTRGARWVGDGVLRIPARIADNRKTLAAFLASGDSELVF